MVEISMYGSGEGLVWATGRGYSTTKKSPVCRKCQVVLNWRISSGLFLGLLKLNAPFVLLLYGGVSISSEVNLSH
jgi:hypothetical protein